MGTRESARATTSSWHRYRMIADNSSDVVYETTPDGVIQWVSPGIEQLLGHTPAAFRGTSARDHVHPDDLGMVNQLRQTVYGGAELDEVPCRFRTADGTFRSCTVRARPVRDATGAVVGAVMALRDAHAQAAALRALTTLSRANAVLIRERTERELLGETCQAVVEAGQYRAAGYARKVDDDERSVQHVTVAGPGSEAVFTATTYWRDEYRHLGLTAPALITGETHVLNDLGVAPETEPWHAITERFGLRSGIALPVRVFGDLDGALIVYSDELGVFDDIAQQLFEDLAADLGYGLERIHEAAELTTRREREAEQRLRLAGILDAQLDPLVLLEAVRDATGAVVDLRYAEANAAALAYNGLTAEQQIGRLFSEMHPDLITSGLTRRYFDVVETGEPVILDDYSYANPNVGSRTRRYDVRAMKCGDGVTLTWRDVTERFLAAQRVSESEHRYRVLTENASDVVWETAPDGTMAWVSESVTRVLGWRPEQLLGRPTTDLFHLEERDRAARNRDLVLTGIGVHEEFRLLTPDGGYRWMALTAQRFHRDGVPLRIVSLRDIHNEVEGRARLEHATRHDPLTGLVTRAVMRRRVQRALDEGTGVTAVLKVGVDGLARINAALGHAAGDRVLAIVAERVVAVVDDLESVARGSGDELIVLATGLADGSSAGYLADALRDAVREPVEVDGQQLLATISVGIATSDRDHSRSAEAMLGTAGMAMREAKNHSPDRSAFVDPALAETAARRLEIETRLRTAIAAGHLRPWFQPVVVIDSGEVVGYEALVRWFEPDGTVVYPDVFLPVAERSLLVVDLDRSVVAQSIETLRTLPVVQHVAVNVSAASLSTPGYAAYVEDLLAVAHVAPSRLILEVTETALLQGVEGVHDAMQHLARLGVRWYVDDFGTGYSSIAHLRDLPVAGLKLDRSFTSGIGEGDETCIRLAQALAGLAAGLGLDTVAEGVETEAERAALAAQGWRHGQGWLYGKAAALPENG